MGRKTGQDRISSRQFGRMLYVEGFGAAGLTCPFLVARCGDRSGWLTFLVYGILLFLFALWLYYMAAGRSGPLPVWASAVYAGRFLVNVILLVCFFGISIRQIYMPGQNMWWLLFPFVLLLFFCSSRDLPRHARFPELLFPWIAVLFTLLILATAAGLLVRAGQGVDGREILPALGDGSLWKKLQYHLVYPGGQGMDRLDRVNRQQLAGEMSTDIEAAIWSTGGGPGLKGQWSRALHAGYLLLICTSPLEMIYLLLPVLGFRSEASGRFRTFPQWSGHPAEESGEQEQRPDGKMRRKFFWGLMGTVFSGFLCNLALWFVTAATLGRTLTGRTPWSVIKIMQLIHLPGGLIERFDLLLAVYWILCMIGLMSAYLCHGRRMVEEGILSAPAMAGESEEHPGSGKGKGGPGFSQGKEESESGRGKGESGSGRGKGESGSGRGKEESGSGRGKGESGSGRGKGNPGSGRGKGNPESGQENEQREIKKRRLPVAVFALFLLGVYVAACLLSSNRNYFQLFILYKKWIDLPLILLLPLLIRLFPGKKEGSRKNESKSKPDSRTKDWSNRTSDGRLKDWPKSRLNSRSDGRSKDWLNSKSDGRLIDGTKVRSAAALSLILIFLLAGTTGCNKQTDAEKKKYILSMYVDMKEGVYEYHTAIARLSSMKEKEAYVPCRVRTVRGHSLDAVEKAFAGSETGRPEWNHIYILYIGPGLRAKPEALIAFLSEWDAAWQKSPDVTVCLCDKTAGQAGYDEDALPGQKVSALTGSLSRTVRVSRTPIDILKRYHAGEKDVLLYGIRGDGKDLRICIRRQRIMTKQ